MSHTPFSYSLLKSASLISKHFLILVVGGYPNLPISRCNSHPKLTKASSSPDMGRKVPMKKIAFGVLSSLLVLSAAIPAKAETPAFVVAQSAPSIESIEQMYEQQRVVTETMTETMAQMKAMMAEMKALTATPNGKSVTTNDLYRQQQSIQQQQQAMMTEMKQMMAEMKQMLTVYRGRATNLK